MRSVLLEQLIEGECIRPDGIVGVAGVVWWVVPVAVGWGREECVGQSGC